MALSPYSVTVEPPFTLEEVENYRKELYIYQFTRDSVAPGGVDLSELITAGWLDGLEDVFNLVEFLAEKYDIKEKDWDQTRRELELEVESLQRKMSDGDQTRRELERKVESLQKKTIELEDTVKELQQTDTTQEGASLAGESVCNSLLAEYPFPLRKVLIFFKSDDCTVTDGLDSGSPGSLEAPKRRLENTELAQSLPSLVLPLNSKPPQWTLPDFVEQESGSSSIWYSHR